MKFRDRVADLSRRFFQIDQAPSVGDRERGRSLKRLAITVQSTENEPGSSTEPILRMVRRMPGLGAEQAVKLWLFYVLREILPVLNATILKRRFLEGRLVIESDDPGLQAALRERWETIPVGALEQSSYMVGGDVWLDFVAENADTYGVGFADKVIGRGGLFVERLIAPNPRSFFFKKINEQGQLVFGGTGGGSTRGSSIDPRVADTSDVRYRLFQRVGRDEVEVNSPEVQLLYMSNDAESPWGRPVAWGLPFVAEIIIRMLVSLNNLWWRSGDPSTFWQIVYDKDSRVGTDQMDDDLEDLETIATNVYRSRASGKVADGFFASTGGAEVKKNNFGENLIIGSLASYVVPHYSLIASQIVAAGDIPSWILPVGVLPKEGIGSVRPRMESMTATQAARLRNLRKMPLAKSFLDLFLILERSASQVGRYSLRWDMANVLDRKEEAEAGKLEAESDDQQIANALILEDVGINDRSRTVERLRERGVVK